MIKYIIKKYDKIYNEYKIYILLLKVNKCFLFIC